MPTSTTISPPPPPPAPPGLPGPGSLTHLLHSLTGLGDWLLPLGVPLLLTLLAAQVIAGRISLRRHQAMAVDARIVEILSPPDVGGEAAAVFWGQMVGLLRPWRQRLLHGQPHLGWELTVRPDGTTIAVWIPGTVPPGMVERAVQAAWPGARTTTRPASPLLPTGGLAEGGWLRLARPDVLPLRADPAGDPVRALLAATTDLHPGDTAAVQILARPVTGARLARAKADAARARGQHTPTLVSRALDLITPGPRPAPSRPAGPVPPEEAAASRAIGVKALQARWETRATYAVTTNRPADRRFRRRETDRLRGRAHSLAAAFSLLAGHNYLNRRPLPNPAAVLNSRRLRRGGLLAVDELATIARLPLDTAVPGLARAGAAAVAPPVGIPTPGPLVKVLGDSETGRPRPVGLTVADARHHLHIVGATGTGKSTLLANLILEDAAAGRGVAVVDPKGDLIDDLLARLPGDAAGRIVLLDPRQATPPCLNILDSPDPDLATDQIVGIVRRIWSDSWGPRTEDLLRAACLTLLHHHQERTRRTLAKERPDIPPPTLLDVVAVLTDPEARERVTAGISDPVLAGFWDWYRHLSDGARTAAIGPLLNKLRALLLRKFARDTLAGGSSTINLTDVLDRGGILLARIPKGAVGEDACQIVGSVILAAIWQAVLRRSAVPPDARRDATAYLDECQNFLNVPGAVEDMLAEARGYRLSLVLAHQHMRQLPQELADALATNARSKVIFGVSPKDGADLGRHVAPVLTPHDLSRLPAFTAATRLVVNAAELPAFTLHTRPLPTAIPGRAAALRAAAGARQAPPPGAPQDPGRAAIDPRPQGAPPPTRDIPVNDSPPQDTDDIAEEGR